MYYTIYQTTCLTSGWIYIGKHQTIDLNDHYMGSGKLLHEAIKHFGLENFSKEILHIFETEEEMDTKEAELVTEEFCSQPGNFNLCPGGKGGWGYINQNEEIRKKCFENSAKVLKEKYGVTSPSQIPSVRKIISKSSTKTVSRTHNEGKLIHNYFNNRSDYQEFLKKSNSEETKEKRKQTYLLREHSKGEKNSQFGTMWITNGTENKKIKKTDSIPEGYRKGRILGPNVPREGDEPLQGL